LPRADHEVAETTGLISTCTICGQMTPLEAAVAGVWLMLPALIPNTAAVLWGGGTPMDFGRSWRGKRILGDGKTWRGFFGGALTGAAIGVLQIIAVDRLDEAMVWGFGDWPWYLCTVLSLGFGSMIGDSAGSMIKRRLGVERGDKAPILDQYNFVVGAFALVLIFRSEWFLDHFVRGNGPYGLILFLVLVPILHRGINIIGYKLGKKNVPW
jgi:CDP-2,3-bis-(O-geranylgeranyl)-sn-glycerol synthase